MAGVNDNLIPPKKGEVRNPKGKPKGTLHISTHIQNMLNDEDFELYLQHPTKGIELFKGAPIKAIIKTAAIKAANNDAPAREWLAKHGWKQQIDITSDDKPIPIFGGLSVQQDNSNDKDIPA